MGELQWIAAVLSALYLRGAPRPFEVERSSWQAVERTLRRFGNSLSNAAHALRLEGHWAEATLIESPGLLDWAEEAVTEGQVLTPIDETYPQRWIRALGKAAPPAVWIRGPIPCEPFLSIVGSRAADFAALHFASECGLEGFRLGFSIASGGAKGCDRAAMRFVPSHRALEILPFGINTAGAVEQAGSAHSICKLSVTAPDEEFTVGAAMERNALIYAISEIAIVAHARFKSGGAWHGAIDAHRRQLSQLVIRAEEGNIAHRALAALGATPIASAEELFSAIGRASGLQPQLIS